MTAPQSSRVEALRIVDGHLLVDRDGETHLIDTGIPHDMEAPAIVSRMLGQPVNRLIGCATLEHGPITIDWPAGVLRHERTRDAEAEEIPLRRLAFGLPSVTIRHQGRAQDAVLDTGAPLSYAPPTAVEGLVPVRRCTDFMPMIGTFEVDVYRTTLEVGSIVLDLEVGVLPPLLQMALQLLTPTGWILGSALFRDRVVTLDLANERMYLGSTGADHGRPSRGEHAGSDAPSKHVPDTKWQSADAPPRDRCAVSGLAWQVHYDIARREQGGATVRALLEFTGEGSIQTSPVDVALVIDRSGSMAGDRLQAALAAAQSMVEALPRESRVAVVAYDNAVRTHAPLTTLSADGRSALHAALAQIDVGGSTALADGWRAGVDQLQRSEPLTTALERGRPRRVVLLSDGHANVGECRADVLAVWARSAANEGITTTTVGIGSGYDEDLLRAMAMAGSGNTWYVPGSQHVSEVLGHELEALRSTTALVVEARVEMNETVGAPFVLGETHAGEIGTTHSKSIVVTYDIPDVTAHESVAGNVHVTWTSVATNEMLAMSVPLRAPADVAANAAVRLAYWRLSIADTRREVVAAADERRHRDARALVDALVARVRREDSRIRTPLEPALHQLRQLIDDVTARRFDAPMRKRALQRSYNAFTGKGRYDERLSTW